MRISQTPSALTLPEVGAHYPSILEFLVEHFPHVPRDRWLARFAEGKVLDEHGRPLDVETRYTPSKRILYFREVEHEPVIPFAEHIVFQNDEILVACKPHFLPVVPGGRYVQECLLNRLRARTGIAELAPLHRIDRDTAGLVLFSVNKATRGLYHDLFMHGRAQKTYLAVAELPQAPPQDRWVVENRLARGEPRFRMTVVPGDVNARSLIELVERRGTRARFRLQPLTGKTHQLRVHMSNLGFGILNDRYYPELLPEREDDFARPLQLLAASLAFRDPLSGRPLEFHSARELLG